MLPFSRSSVRPASTDDGADLFDEHFQKRLEYLALVSRKTFLGSQRAERRSRRIGSGVEFADYREYSRGDDVRQVDWNVYARIGRLLLKLYEEEEDLSVYLLLDCSGSMGFGSPAKLNYAKQLTAALAYVALTHLDRVSIFAFDGKDGHHFAPTRGRNRIFTVFDFLRGLSPRGEVSLGRAMRSFVARNPRRGVAILVSDLFDQQGVQEGINQLRYARFETYAMQIVSADDVAPSLLGDLELQDAESGATQAVTVTPKLLARYQAAYQQLQRDIQLSCRNGQVPLFRLSTTVPVDEAMLQVLRHGGVVR